MHGLTGNGDYGEEGGGEFLLGGGPALQGVDYEGQWLTARATAQALNKLFAEMGLNGEARVYAQAGWADDGSGVVFCTGTVAGGERLRALLGKWLGADGS